MVRWGGKPKAAQCQPDVFVFGIGLSTDLYLFCAAVCIMRNNNDIQQR